jgi:hypothetical protein
VCDSVCGDGVLAFDEVCEMTTVSHIEACDYRTCETKLGWKCEDFSCEISLQGLSARKQQKCAPVCGDRRIIDPYEECDDGDAAAWAENYGKDWPRPWLGGNGPDRYCTNDCTINRVFSCHGDACASRRAPMYTMQDSGMPLFAMLFQGRETHVGQATMLEGLQLTHDIRKPVFQLPGASVVLGKRLIFDPTFRGSTRTHRAIVAASFFGTLVQLDQSTSMYRSIMCDDESVIQTRRAEISVGKGDTPSAIACSWKLQPLDYQELKLGRMLMNVTSLSLAPNESVVFEELNQAGQNWTQILRFDGPVELGQLLGPAVTFANEDVTELISYTSAVAVNHSTNGSKANSSELMYRNRTRTIRVMQNDTHFDLPIDLRIRFFAPGRKSSPHPLGNPPPHTPLPKLCTCQFFCIMHRIHSQDYP